ncbi:MAG: hypothetical protein ABJQ90_00030, partial [Parasphingorhabdus sp.]
VRGPPLVNPETYHNLATADIRLLGCFAPNHRKREMTGRQEIEFQQLMGNLELWKAFTEKFTPLPPGTDVDGIETVLAEIILSAAAKIAPSHDRAFAHRSKKQQPQRGLESSWETP